MEIESQISWHEFEFGLKSKNLPEHELEQGSNEPEIRLSFKFKTSVYELWIFYPSSAWL